MLAVTIGISSGLLIILIISLIKQLNIQLIYGLILSGIGFLYVGFTWTDLQAFVVNSIQAVFFLFFAYIGTRKSINILATGYLLHGSWDIVYHLFEVRSLIPPHYDLFCSSLDFTIAAYLFVFNSRQLPNKVSSSR